jgi:hypothetical protein
METISPDDAARDTQRTMKGSFAIVIASAVVLSAAFSREARAEKRVVVEPFSGPAAMTYRIWVMKSLDRAGFDVVPDRQVIVVRSGLGAQRVGDSYPEIARKLKLSGYISGFISGGRRPRARIIVRTPAGVPIGGQVFRAARPPKLLAMVNGGAGRLVVSVLGAPGRRSPAGAGADAGVGAVAGKMPDWASELLESSHKTSPADDETPRKRNNRQDVFDESTPVAKTAKAAEATEPAEAEPAGKSPGGKDESEDSAPVAEDAGVRASDLPDALLAARVDRAGRSASGEGIRPQTGFNLAVVLRMFTRNFTYNQSFRGAQAGYVLPEQKFKGLPLVPAPGIAADYFPNPSLGFFASYNKVIASSRDADGNVYKTDAFSWLLGARSRFGSPTLQFEPSIAYGRDVFRIESSVATQQVQVAPVDYQHARIGGGVRLPFGTSGGIFSAGGYYLHLFSAGDILDRSKYFEGKAIGGQAFALVTIPLDMVKGLDLGIGADFRRIAFAFVADPNAARIAGGAVDQYLGLHVAVGFHVGK